jgi:selenium metabolism protein YedF
MKTIDCCGKTCPLPVIETKKVLEDKEVNEITVLVDNSISRENVMRFLESQGFSVTAMEEKGKHRIEGARNQETTEQLSITNTKKLLVFVDGETVGRGSEELGAILMRSFLLTLKELNPLPWRIIFINSGVKLAVEGSPYIGALNDLVAIGAEILSCGTCLDYYRVKDRLMVGRISNMHEIESSFIEATNVIKP